MAEQAQRILPKDDAFAVSDYRHPTMQKGTKYFLFDRVEYPEDGGIYVYYKGKKYPCKGLPYIEAIVANDLFKKAIKAALAPIGKSTVLSLVAFALMPWKWKLQSIDKAVTSWVELGDNAYAAHFLQPNRYCFAAQEIWRATAIGLNALGVHNPEICDRAGRIVATVFEYDDSYRYFLQDLAGATSKEEMLKKPVQEIARLGQVYYNRVPTFDDGYRDIRVATTVRRMFRVLAVAAVHPKVRKAIKAGVQAINWSRLAMDEADRYQNLMRTNYDFGGISIKDRAKEFAEIHKDGFPPMVEIVA